MYVESGNQKTIMELGRSVRNWHISDGRLNLDNNSNGYHEKWLDFQDIGKN